MEDLQYVPGTKFTMFWNLKNFSMFGNKENNSLLSNIVVVPSLNNSKWYLKLISKGPREKSVMCFLCRTDDGPDEIRISYSISVDSCYAVEFQTFRKDSTSTMPGIINLEQFISDVSSGLSKDVLRIECHLWRHINSNADAQSWASLDSPYPVAISMTTKIAIENRSFFYEVKNFSSRPENDMVSVGLASAGSYGLKLDFRLWTTGETLRVILREHEESARGQLFVLKCNIHFLDIFKKRRLLYSGRSVFNCKGDGSDKTWNFPLSISKKELIENKDLYLPNDELLLHCKIEVSGTVSVNLMESTIYDTSDAQTSLHNFKWGMYLDYLYNKHRVFYRLLAILIVILSFLPHLFSDDTV